MLLENKNFNSSMSTIITFGANSIDNQLAQTIKSENKEKAFIATDKGLVSTGIVDKIVDLLATQGISSAVFSDVSPNPSADSVMDGATFYSNEQCDMIIAIGGGSAMDFGKAVGVVATNPGHILDYRRGENEIVSAIPLLIAIPTTIGTGSEVTAISVITDTSINRKFIIASPYLMPKTAFIDPVLTQSLPRHTVAATGADALVHAIEAYTSVKSNPISDGLALQAIRMIIQYLPLTYSQPDHLEARSQAHLASTIAGMAFGLSGLGLVHSCSHPMSAIYKVPHGIANAILLPYVTEYNLIASVKKYADIARIFDSSLHSEDDHTASECLVELLKDFLRSIDIPENFKYLGIEFTEENIQQLANDAMDDKGTIPANSRKVYRDDVVKIYQTVLTFN